MRTHARSGLSVLILALCVLLGSVDAGIAVASPADRLAGADVRVVVNSELKGETTTDASGWYQVVPLDVEPGSYTFGPSVRVSRQDVLQMSADGVPVAGGFDSIVNLVTDYAEGSVQGVVFDQVSGFGVSGAVVSVYLDDMLLDSATTLPDGSYLLSAVPVEISLKITVEAAGYVGMMLKSFAVRPGLTTDLPLWLEPAYGNLTGVVTSRGIPVSGATVTLTLDGMEQTPFVATSGADGTYLFDSIPASPKAKLGVQAAGYSGMTILGGARVAAGITSYANVNLEPLPPSSASGQGTLSLCVLDGTSGLPLSVSADVNLVKYATYYYHKQGTTTAGEIVFSDVDANAAESPYVLHVSAPGYTSLEITGVAIHQGDTTHLEIAIWPYRGSLSVMVTDGVTGLPLEASIELVKYGTYYSHKSGTTSASGEILFTEVDANHAAKPYRLNASVPGYVYLQTEGLVIAAGGTTFVHLKAWPTKGKINIKVRDALTAEPLSAYAALIPYGLYYHHKDGNSDTDGNLVFSNVEANRGALPYRLEVSLTGYVAFRMTGIVVAGGDETDLEVDLWPSLGTLVVNARDGATGLPLSCEVSLIEHGLYYVYKSGVTSIDGRLVLSGVRANQATRPYKIQISADGYSSRELDGIMVAGGRITTVDAEVWPSEGTLRVESAPRGAAVYVKIPGTAWMLDGGLVDEHGVCVITLPANEAGIPYFVEVSMGGNWDQDARVSGVHIFPGKTTTIYPVMAAATVAQQPALGRVAGHVVDILTGAPLQGAHVYVYNVRLSGSLPVAEAVTDQNGEFEVQDLDWGTVYQIHVSMDGYVRLINSRLAVRGDTTYFSSFEMAPSAGSISGTMTVRNRTPFETRFNVYAIAAPQGAGLVEGSGNYALGESITLVATPSPGFEFTNWTEAQQVVSSSAAYTFTVESERVLTANFAPMMWNISVSANLPTAGWVTGSGTYAHGEQVTLEANSSPPYAFARWTEDGLEVSTDAVYVFTAASHRNLVAVFTTSEALFGDLNRDGYVNLADLALVAGSYRLSATDHAFIPEHDLNSDGVIDIFDVVLIARAMTL